MVTLERPYKLDTGTAQCTNCGSNIRKYYMGINDYRPICSKCVNAVFNVNVSKTELEAPMWLLDVANEYILHRVHLTQYKNIPIIDVSDFLNGFKNKKYAFDGIVTVSIKQFVRGKPVKNGWLIAIHHHLKQKYQEILEDEKKPVRKFLVCGNCKKPLYYKGVSGSGKVKYQAYHCLSGNQCKNCATKVDVMHYGGNQVRALN